MRHSTSEADFWKDQFYQERSDHEMTKRRLELAGAMIESLKKERPIKRQQTLRRIFNVFARISSTNN